MAKKNGFSLIEIVVVVGIMGILAAAGVASYNKMNDRAQVEQAAQMLATQLRTFQKQADSGVNNCNHGVEFDGVKVKYSGPRKLAYCESCGGGCVGAGEFELPNEVVLQGFNPEILFRTMSRGVDGGISMVVTKGAISYQVIINQAGGISVAKSEEQ